LALPDLRPLPVWDGLEPKTIALVFDARFERYARGDEDGTVSVRRVADDRELVQLRRRLGRRAGAYDLRFSPDGKFLAVQYPGDIHGLHVWDLAPPGRLAWTAPILGGMDFSPDGTLVALRTGDRKDQAPIRLHHAATGNLLKKIAGAPGQSDLAFSPNG